MGSDWRYTKDDISPKVDGIAQNKALSCG